MNALRPMTLTLGLVGLWQLLVTLTEVPPYIRPAPCPWPGPWPHTCRPWPGIWARR